MCSYTDKNLSFEILTDEESGLKDPSPSLSFSTDAIQFRQFATKDQLIALRDALIEVYPFDPLYEDDLPKTNEDLALDQADHARDIEKGDEAIDEALEKGDLKERDWTKTPYSDEGV